MVRGSNWITDPSYHVSHETKRPGTRGGRELDGFAQRHIIPTKMEGSKREVPEISVSVSPRCLGSAISQPFRHDLPCQGFVCKVAGQSGRPMLLQAPSYITVPPFCRP